MRTLLWDVSDLDHPTLLGYHTDELNTVDHNLYVRGRHVFQANYSAGLHVLDVSAIASGQLKTVATFDTYPENDKIEYRSAWSVYPYFDSGVVIVSTISEGLFVLRPNLPQILRFKRKTTWLKSVTHLRSQPLSVLRHSLGIKGTHLCV